MKPIVIIDDEGEVQVGLKISIVDAIKYIKNHVNEIVERTEQIFIERSKK